MSSVRWKSARPFYVRLWYGDYQLPVAFFVIGVAGLLGLAQWNLNPAFRGNGTENGLYWLSVAGLISDSARQPFTLVLLVVIVNCVWRSAYRFEGNPVWRGLAKVAIVAGATGVAFVATRAGRTRLKLPIGPSPPSQFPGPMWHWTMPFPGQDRLMRGRWWRCDAAPAMRRRRRLGRGFHIRSERNNP